MPVVPYSDRAPKWKLVSTAADDLIEECFFFLSFFKHWRPLLGTPCTCCCYLLSLLLLAYVLYVVAYVKAVEIVLKEMFNSGDLSLAFITFAVLLY